MFKNKSLLLLAVIVFLSAFSRLYRLDLNPPSLYSDEVDIGYQVKSLLETGKDYQGYTLPLQFHSFSDVRTSLPIYATTLVSLIPGVSLDLAIRLTPAIFSLLSIILIYFLTNNLFTLFKIKKENNLLEPGVWASLSLSLLPWHYTYSRIGFELSMLFFFVVFGLFLYTRFLQNKNKTLLVLGLVVLSLVPMVYSTAKLSVIFYPLILFLLPGGYEFFKIKKNWVYLLILFIPLGVLFLNGGAKPSGWFSPGLKHQNSPQQNYFYCKYPHQKSHQSYFRRVSLSPRRRKSTPRRHWLGNVGKISNHPFASRFLFSRLKKTQKISSTSCCSLDFRYHPRRTHQRRFQSRLEKLNDDSSPCLADFYWFSPSTKIF